MDRAFDLAGGFGIFRQGPFERLLRDARLGRIHPANSMLTHELRGEVDAGDQPGRGAEVGLGGRETGDGRQETGDGRRETGRQGDGRQGRG